MGEGLLRNMHLYENAPHPSFIVESPSRPLPGSGRLRPSSTGYAGRGHSNRQSNAGAGRRYDPRRITGAAMLSIMMLMQEGLPLASARSIAPGKSAARSTNSP